MKLLLNSQCYEYDIRGMLQAFFPWEKFVTDEAAEDTAGLSVSFVFDGEETSENLRSASVRFYQEGFDEKEEVDLLTGDVSLKKTKLKQTIYHLLSCATGRTLPWGTLSGIRPTKIATRLLEEGKTDAEILQSMTENLYVSEEKSRLSIDIAKREKRLYEQLKEPGYSLYVGIPFCPSTCLYCSFSSFTIGDYEKEVWDYCRTVEKELMAVKRIAGDRPLHSVYFGGGTPTAVSAEQLDFLLSAVETHFDLSPVLEWTVEAGRPETLTKEKLEVLRKHPVTRLSINPQTMHQKTLDAIGRKHTVSDVYTAFRAAREAGFDNINMDLILGLPGEDTRDAAETIRQVVGLSPESVTVHSLAVKRSSRLNLEKEKYERTLSHEAGRMMDICREELEKVSLYPYYLYRQKNIAGNLENVGFAKDGKESIYNILIMEERETIIAVGAGGITKYVRGEKIDRAPNVHDVRTYLRNIDEMIHRKEELLKEW